jgi:hypothetical protein
MPWFYLHVRCDDELIEDDEGVEFADIGAANTEAIRSIRSLVCGDVTTGSLYLDLSIEIWDRERHLATVKFDDAIRTVTNPNTGPSATDTRLPRVD